jgi:hypothetical protein
MPSPRHRHHCVSVEISCEVYSFLAWSLLFSLFFLPFVSNFYYYFFALFVVSFSLFAFASGTVFTLCLAS